MFSEQLLFSPFFTTVTYSQQLFFQNSFFFRVTILQSSHFLRIRSPLWQLLFGTTVFSLFRIKISKKELLFQSRYSTQYQKILEKANFSEKRYSALPTFSGELLFQSNCLFKRATFLQHAFSEMLLFHSYASFPQLHFFFICQ